MSDIRIRCNNIPRPLMYWSDLTDKEREEWLPTHSDDDGLVWFRYRGEVYYLGDFTRAPKDIAALGFDDCQPMSHWDAIVVRYFDKDGYELDGGDSIIVGRADW